MDITFANAPLIELIAEVRWVPQGSTILAPPAQQQPTVPTVFLGGTTQEEFYLRLGGVLHNAGFTRSERLSPAGMPFVLHQPVYRFKSEAEDKRSVLYQVGFGIFSVHALPPYHSWSRFLPFVRNGIDTLLRSRPEADAAQPFVQANVRYIDFFGEQLMRGETVQAFISDVFGIGVQLPASISRLSASNQLKSLFARVAVPIENGDLMLSVGDGQFNNRPGIIVDWTVSSYGIAPTFEGAMRVFEYAHSVIHDLFLDLTRPIHELLGPEGVPQQ